MKKLLGSLCVFTFLISSITVGHAAERLSLATGGTTGVYYPIGSAIASVISKNVEGVQVTAESTGASIANLKMMASNDVDMMFGGSGIVYEAYYGKGKPFDSKPVKNLRGVVSIYPEIFQLVVLKDSGINSVADLKGKRVAVGAPGSGTEKQGRIVLAAYGMSYDDISAQFLSFGEAVTGLKDGHIDCAIIYSGVPTSAVMDISTLHEIKILPIDKDKIEKLLKDLPYLTAYTIPGNSYTSIPEPVMTLGTPAMLIAQKDLSEETVYNMLKAIFDNLKVIGESHVQGKALSLKSALDGMSVPLHPGAIKFYKEKGIDVSKYMTE